MTVDDVRAAGAVVPLRAPVPSAGAVGGDGFARALAAASGTALAQAEPAARPPADGAPLQGQQVGALDTVYGSGEGCRCGVGDGASAVTADGVPRELQAYGSGRVPAAALRPVSGAPGQAMWAPAARSLDALREAAAADGVRVDVVGTYRASGGGYGWGTDVDLRPDVAVTRWLRTHAARFGFEPADTARPGHWTYRPTH